MIDEVLKDLDQAIVKALDALKKDLAKLRTGRASPSMLDGIKVEAYGTVQLLQHLATVTAPQPRLLVVKPYDRSIINNIEKAIRTSDLGLNPQNDGEFIKIPIPPLTEERRKELVKTVKKIGEEIKISIRHARREAIDTIETMVDEGELPEDDGHRAKKQIQQKVDKAMEKIDEIIEQKEKDIMEGK